jgi:uncharacterized protein (TIGR02996 family)
MRTFEYSDATSHKFWNIDLGGKSFTVTYGRIGSTGQKQVKTFASEAAAQKEHDKLVKEKLTKGYRETTPAAKSQPASLKESLESALVENPNDLASHMAYADYLTEEGDPRGEFIHVQLQLEDPSLRATERAKLQKREVDLLKAHGKTWLGDLAPYLLRKTRKPGSDFLGSCRFSRGWLDMVEARDYTVAFTRLLAKSPEICLLRRLMLDDNAFEMEGEFEPGPDIPEDCEDPQLYPLLRSPYLGNVRVFVLGELIAPEDEIEAMDGGFNCQTGGDGAVGVVKLMPKLEELYLLARDIDTAQLFSLKTLNHLRVLQVYHARNYPLVRLAKNPSLGRVTHLLFHPHALDPDDEKSYIRLAGVRELVRSKLLSSLTHLRLRLSDMGDAGVKDIVASGILKRLKMLDLRHGCITDDGARLLAACPDTKRLELLDLAHNAISETGVKALREAGIKVYAEYQWTPGEHRDWGEDEYLYAGDIE